jgi:hypothetical protein
MEPTPEQQYFRLLDDKNVPNRWYLKAPVDPSDREIDPRLFLDARPVRVQMPLRLPHRRSGRALDFTLADFDMPVLRGEFATRLKQLASNDLQLIPVQVPDLEDPFYILNILSSRPCLDLSRSSVTYWTDADGRSDRVGQYRMVTDLRVDPTKIGEHQICRITGWEIAIIVSATIAEQLSAATGTALQAV